MISPVQLMESSNDERRIMYSANVSGGSMMRVFVGVKKEPIGKHAYKAPKWQAFLFSRGEGMVLVCDVDDSGKRVGNIREFEVKADSFFVSPPLTALTFYLKPGTEFSCFSEVVFSEIQREDQLIKCPWLVSTEVAKKVWG